MQLNPLSEQVVVVVGAGSPLGLKIARGAAKAGAAVALADRDEAAVRKAAAELAKTGARVHPVVADGGVEEGCQRIGRAATARFDRIDGWVDATGSDAGLAFAAEGLVKHLAARGGQGALVAFARRLPQAAEDKLQDGRGILAPTLITLPRGWRADAPPQAAVEAALYALSHPMGHMAVAARGERLTALTEASRHRGVVLGVGLVALAGVAAWLNRSRISTAARTARPRLARRRAKPAVSVAATGPRVDVKLFRRAR